jgi:Adaptor complexes medium subunit family
MEVAARPPVALTNAVSWRSEGIKHRKNEIFLDVVERLNLLVSSNGTVLHRCDLSLGVHGKTRQYCTRCYRRRPRRRRRRRTLVYKYCCCRYFVTVHMNACITLNTVGPHVAATSPSSRLKPQALAAARPLIALRSHLNLHLARFAARSWAPPTRSSRCVLTCTCT